MVRCMRTYGCGDTVPRTWLPGMKNFCKGWVNFFFLMTLLEFALVSEKAIKNFCLVGGSPPSPKVLRARSSPHLTTLDPTSHQPITIALAFYPFVHVHPISPHLSTFPFPCIFIISRCPSSNPKLFAHHYL